MKDSLLIYFCFIFVLIYSCIDRKPISAEDDGLKDQLKNEQLLDSLKWIMYSINFNGNVNCIKDPTNTEVSIVSLPIQLDTIYSYDSKNQYLFSLEDDSNNCSGNLDFCGLILNRDSFISPFMFGISVDSFDNQNYTNRFLVNSDLAFRKYLISYHGHLTEWVKTEAVKKGVLLKER